MTIPDAIYVPKNLDREKVEAIYHSLKQFLTSFQLNDDVILTLDHQQIEKYQPYKIKEGFWGFRNAVPKEFYRDWQLVSKDTMHQRCGIGVIGARDKLNLINSYGEVDRVGKRNLVDLIEIMQFHINNEYQQEIESL